MSTNTAAVQQAVRDARTHARTRLSMSTNTAAVQQALRRAVIDDDTDGIRSCVARGADIDAPGPWIAPSSTSTLTVRVQHHVDATTPLQLACYLRHFASVQTMIALGAVVDAPHGGDGGLALAWAAETNDAILVKYLIDAGADVNAVPPNGWTAPNCAAYTDSIDAMRVLVERGAHVHTTSVHAGIRQFKNCMSIAAIYGACRCGEYLLSHGAPLYDGNRVSVVELAAEHGHVHFIEMTMRHAQVVALPPTEVTALWNRALYEAVACKRASVVHALFEAGVEPPAATHARDLLQIALTNRDDETVRALMRGGVLLERTHLNHVMFLVQGSRMVDLLLEQNSAHAHCVASHVLATDALRQAMQGSANTGGPAPKADLVEVLMRHGARARAQKVDDDDDHDREANAMALCVQVAGAQGVAAIKDVAVALLRDVTLTATDLQSEPLFVALVHEILGLDANALDDVLRERLQSETEGVVIAALRRPCDVYAEQWQAINDRLYAPPLRNCESGDDSDDGDDDNHGGTGTAGAAGTGSSSGGGVLFEQARVQWNALQQSS